MPLMNLLLDPHFSSSDPRVNLRQCVVPLGTPMDQRSVLCLGKNETTEECLLLTTQGALQRRILKRLLGTVLGRCIRGITANSILGSAGGQFVPARPRDERTAVRSHRTYLKRRILATHDATTVVR